MQLRRGMYPDGGSRSIDPSRAAVDAIIRNMTLVQHTIGDLFAHEAAILAWRHPGWSRGGKERR